MRKPLDSANPIWVKLCGMTRAMDIAKAQAEGADAVGLIFVPASPRAVSIPQATQCLNEVKAGLQRVGLFMNPSMAFVEEVLSTVPLDLLQFHGQESAAFCAAFDRPYIKAMSFDEGIGPDQWLEQAQAHSAAWAWLIDSHATGQMGGTGQVGDWERWASLCQRIDHPWILAGGLHANIIRTAQQSLKPRGIDLASGVETQPGVKDHGKIEHLMQTVRNLPTGLE